MNNDCIFCKIIKGDIPSQKVYEDDIVYVFKDIDPKAEVHLLAVPKKHYKLFSEMTESDKADIGKILFTISQNVESWGLKNGYRVTVNQGDDTGQTVFHLHIHIQGGQKLKWCDHKK